MMKNFLARDLKFYDDFRPVYEVSVEVIHKKPVDLAAKYEAV